MKKLLILLIGAFPFCAAAQVPIPPVNPDTVFIRNIQLQLQDWCYILGKSGDVFPDSLTAYEYRRIRTKIKATNPNPTSPNWTAPITIDSIRARIAVNMYMLVVSAPANEVAPRFVAIRGELQSKPRLIPFISTVMSGGQSVFDNFRNRGKRMAVDN